MTQELSEQSEVVAPRPGKDEMNFAEFPIALLTDRVPKGQNSIRFEDEIYDERRKKMITRRRIIEGSEEFGLPTATDDAVILALIQLTKQKSNFTQREVEFTRLELIKMLGWPNEGKSYERIKLSLLRITNVTYNYVNAWWDPRQKNWTTRAFHIIDSVEINDSRSAGGQTGLFSSRIAWGDAVFESFQSGFLRNIDFQLCMRLEHPTALRMYRFLGKRFHVRSDWSFDLKEFAYEHIGLGRNYEGGTQIARKLQPAINELEEAGFLEPLSPQERFGKKGRDWSIRFIQKAPALPAPNLPVATPSDASLPPLLATLIGLGVTRSKAEELTEKHTADMLQAKIEVFQWLAGKQDKRVAKSPAGYLVKSIEDDYATPKGFVSQAERNRLDEARRIQEHQNAEARRRERLSKTEERKQRERAEAILAAMTPDQLAKLDAESAITGDAKAMAAEAGPFGQTMRQLRRIEQVIRALEDGSRLVQADSPSQTV